MSYKVDLPEEHKADMSSIYTCHSLLLLLGKIVVSSTLQLSRKLVGKKLEKQPSTQLNIEHSPGMGSPSSKPFSALFSGEYMILICDRLLTFIVILLFHLFLPPSSAFSHPLLLSPSSSHATSTSPFLLYLQTSPSAA